MIECVAAGMSPHHFYDLTYAEIYVVYEAIGRRSNRDHALTIWGAYHAAFLPKMKRPPTLQALMRPFVKVRDMSRKSLRSAVLGLAKTWGIEPKFKKRGE